MPTGYRQILILHFSIIIVLLFVDIEYNAKANPNITSTENEILLNEFIQELSDEIQTHFNLTIDRTNIVDLDSSTTNKFSRHFIVHLPNGELFPDAPACGIFVKNFIGRLADEVATGMMKEKGHLMLSNYLFVNNKVIDHDSGGGGADDKEGLQFDHEKNKVQNEDTSGLTSLTPPFLSQPFISQHADANIANKNQTCFIDTGVYTRNRLFRILGSAKYGKPSSAALRIASMNQFPFPDGFGNEAFYESCTLVRNTSTSQQRDAMNHDNHNDEHEKIYVGYEVQHEDELKKVWKICDFFIPF